MAAWLRRPARETGIGMAERAAERRKAPRAHAPRGPQCCRDALNARAARRCACAGRLRSAALVAGIGDQGARHLMVSAAASSSAAAGSGATHVCAWGGEASWDGEAAITTVPLIRRGLLAVPADLKCKGPQEDSGAFFFQLSFTRAHATCGQVRGGRVLANSGARHAVPYPRRQQQQHTHTHTEEVHKPARNSSSSSLFTALHGTRKSANTRTRRSKREGGCERGEQRGRWCSPRACWQRWRGAERAHRNLPLQVVHGALNAARILGSSWAALCAELQAASASAASALHDAASHAPRHRARAEGWWHSLVVDGSYCRLAA